MISKYNGNKSLGLIGCGLAFLCIAVSGIAYSAPKTASLFVQLTEDQDNVIDLLCARSMKKELMSRGVIIHEPETGTDVSILLVGSTLMEGEWYMRKEGTRERVTTSESIIDIDGDGKYTEGVDDKFTTTVVDEVDIEEAVQDIHEPVLIAYKYSVKNNETDAVLHGGGKAERSYDLEELCDDIADDVADEIASSL